MSVFNKELPVAIGTDHAGYDDKEVLKAYLQELGWTVDDKGTHSKDSVDYPDFAHPVAAAVETGKATFGILICGSGIGVSIAANRHKGVRAALAYNKEIAKLCREHNDANVLCLPARFISMEEMKEYISIFTSTAFEGGRHVRRVEKIEY
jgi:ribose 5-phosphate isomerase B